MVSSGKRRSCSSSRLVPSAIADGRAFAILSLASLALLGCNRTAVRPDPDAVVSTRVLASQTSESRGPSTCGHSPHPSAPISGDGGKSSRNPDASPGAGGRAGAESEAPAIDAADASDRDLTTIHTVILISVDGLASRFIEDLDALGQLPNFARLRDEGASTLNARTEARISVTIPNHVSMVSSRPAVAVPELAADVPHGVLYNSDPGGDSTIHDENPELGYVATAFDEVHDRGGHTWLFTGKDKFELFQRSYSAPHARKDVIGDDDGDDKIDDFLYEWESDPLVVSFLDALASGVAERPAGPNFGMLHIRDTDTEGHSAGWGSDEYLAALMLADTLLGEVLDSVSSSEALSGAALILTTDHGGVDYGHNDHTDDLVYRIPFFVWGPGIPRGVDLYSVCGPGRRDPREEAPLDGALPQPVRNGDAGNLALALLGLPPIDGSLHQGLQIDVSEPQCGPADAGAMGSVPIDGSASVDGGSAESRADAGDALTGVAGSGARLDASAVADGGDARDASLGIGDREGDAAANTPTGTGDAMTDEPAAGAAAGDDGAGDEAAGDEAAGDEAAGGGAASP